MPTFFVTLWAGSGDYSHGWTNIFEVQMAKKNCCPAHPSNPSLLLAPPPPLFFVAFHPRLPPPPPFGAPWMNASEGPRPWILGIC